jgi:ADP-heptose:LPS heptosyltransferase
LKPSLLIFELWGLGDLVIATPFLKAACEKYSVTLVAKPFAKDLQARLWPEVEVVPFVAPWTAFQGKYKLWNWPWAELYRLRRKLSGRRFDFGVSARWDPRDHFLLRAVRAKMRLGYPRLRSQMFLTEPLTKPAPRAHRYEYWNTLGQALDLTMPDRDSIVMPRLQSRNTVFVHTGAGQPIRVWPLERYLGIVKWLRAKNHRVVVACDPDQREWWLRAGEAEIHTPKTVNELLSLVDDSAMFIGNDSGPGHLAAFCGVPTLSLFGPQLPEWFSPLHPESLCIEGKACPYKPCSDYCRFETPRCLWGISEDEMRDAVQRFLDQHVPQRFDSSKPLINL